MWLPINAHGTGTLWCHEFPSRMTYCHTTKNCQGMQQWAKGVHLARDPTPNELHGMCQESFRIHGVLLAWGGEGGSALSEIMFGWKNIHMNTRTQSSLLEVCTAAVISVIHLYCQLFLILWLIGVYNLNFQMIAASLTLCKGFVKER